MPSTRYYQWTVANHPGFLGAIEASVMKNAAAVLAEGSNVPNTAIRKETAKRLMRGLGSTRERLLRLYAWLAVFDPNIAGAVFDVGSGDITPQNIEDADLDTLVSTYWTLVSQFEDSAT
jgi:hypothetical protein